MKHSNFQTPRTMSDAVWLPSGDPVDFSSDRNPWSIRNALVPAICLVALVVIGVCLAMALVPTGA